MEPDEEPNVAAVREVCEEVSIYFLILVLLCYYCSIVAYLDHCIISVYSFTMPEIASED